MKQRLLIVEDKEEHRKIIKKCVSEFETVEAETTDDGLRMLAHPQQDKHGVQQDIHGVILDLAFGDDDRAGLKMLATIKEKKEMGGGADCKRYAVPVIVYAGMPREVSALQAMRHGAFAVVHKSDDPQRLLNEVKVALDIDEDPLEQIKGRSDDILLVKYYAMRYAWHLASRPEGVLILGESGTGKELVAKVLHGRSMRRGKRLISVNAAALGGDLVTAELFGHEKGAFTGATKARKGLLADADGSTLFLDEIGELPMDTQKKLLRVLENGEVTPVGGGRNKKAKVVDVRLVTATNRDLSDAVRKGTFRRDLYHRITTGGVIRIPPLRERGGDVMVLAEHFVDMHMKERTEGKALVSGGARGYFMRLLKDAGLEDKGYPWRGNVRELKNKIAWLMRRPFHERIDDAASGNDGERVLLYVNPSDSLDEQLRQSERQIVERALVRNLGDVEAAADSLGRGKSSFYKSIDRLGIDLGDLRKGL